MTTMTRRRIGTLAGLTAGAMLLAGCGNTMTNSASQVVLSGPPEGMASGASTEVTMRGDRPATLTGSLHRVSADWIVIDLDGTGDRRWIALDTVAWIEQAAPASAPSPAPTPVP